MKHRSEDRSVSVRRWLDGQPDCHFTEPHSHSVVEITRDVGIIVTLSWCRDSSSWKVHRSYTKPGNGDVHKGTVGDFAMAVLAEL